ncbi:toll/interleukin-1 receptor domain-containing protein [Priestia koreensis]|uniref:toll/interleukin-1 receptor domain-containing protein n=1 Tax=Priestia koreensis TaxID=284581 RepID=UPI00345952D7
MKLIVKRLRDDLTKFLAKKDMRINENALDILTKGELLCFNKSIPFVYTCLLVPLLRDLPHFRQIINRHGGNAQLAATFVEETLDEYKEYEEYDGYGGVSRELLYSTEDKFNYRYLIIKNCIRYARESNRLLINESDLVQSILDSHDNECPPYDNQSWTDHRLHTAYNTISHFIGRFSEYLWVKNDDIRWELSNFNNKSYDIAISFAGEDRDVAEEIIEKLSVFSIRVFYDKFERASLWGKDLYTHLSDVYGEKSKYCLMLVSKNYARKHWTNLERQAAQARALREEYEYILPLRLDDTIVPGLLPTTGYIDIRYTNIDEIVSLIRQKILQMKDMPS